MCRGLQDSVYTVAPFPWGSHVSSLEAADGLLPAPSCTCIADRAAEHGPILLPSPLFVVESLWLPHNSPQALGPQDCSTA